MLDILATDSDTTLFSLANSNYEAIVQSLFRAKTCAGLTETELDAFKAQFGGTAFLCPVKGCVLGFRSETELNEHKAQRHRQRLKCYEGKCIHNDVGFANKASLHQHVRKVHKKETPRIPTALKRKGRIEDYESLVHWSSDKVDGRPSDRLTSPTNIESPQQPMSIETADQNTEVSATQSNKPRDDWFVVFNPTVARQLDVDLVHTLSHDSVVCCARFSMDGKYMATGCNKTAQVYDVLSGEKIWILDTPENYVENYIRALCFSPDGKYIVTGSEDKLIRVNIRAVTAPAASLLTSPRSGISLPAPSA